MDILRTILELINSVPSDAWSIISEVIVAALITSPLLIGLKKWWGIHSDKIMLALTILGSLIAGGAMYLHNDPTLAPWFALVQGWLIFATTQPVYRFFIKGLFIRLGAWFQSKVEEAAKYNAEVQASKQPTVADFPE